jgi:hypothetical protein
MRQLICAALAGGAMLASGAAFAGEQDFNLVNGTGFGIQHVYVSPIRKETWGRDVLGRDILGDGQAVAITFPDRKRACKWDLKVVYQDGRGATWHEINLCQISKVTLHWNPNNNETSARVE